MEIFFVLGIFEMAASTVFLLLAIEEVRDLLKLLVEHHTGRKP